MERGSDKHAPRIDEELDQETKALQTAEPTESRVEGFRKDEELDDDLEPLDDGPDALDEAEASLDETSEARGEGP